MDLTDLEGLLWHFAGLTKGGAQLALVELMLSSTVPALT